MVWQLIASEDHESVFCGRVNSVFSSVINLVWREEHAKMPFVSYNEHLLSVWSLMSRPHSLMPHQIFCESCFCLLHFTVEPAIVCCLSCSGMTLIISMSSHSFYWYAQGSGHLSMKGNLFEKDLSPATHTHTHTYCNWFYFLPCHASIAWLQSCCIPMSIESNLTVLCGFAGEQGKKQQELS